MRSVLGPCALAAAILSLTATARTQTAPTAHDAADVVAGMQSFWQNLKSYQVPVSLNGNVRVSFVSVPFNAQGIEYYRAPNQQAIHLDGASMGSPQTWPSNYAMTLEGTQTNRGHLAYVLVGTPKKLGSNVKTITMWVAVKTFAVETVAFAYQNGSALSLDFSHHGPSPYHLPTRIAVNAKFPSYSGSAQIVYGTYQTNVPIPNSAFEKQ